jgi:hypothetical protein
VSKSDLRIDWATHAAAKFACENWHYSGTLPVGKMVKIGAWENGKFIGVAIFAWGMNRNLGSPYGLGITECCELVRVALTKHACHVTRIVALAIRFLKKANEGLRLIVSFADPAANHHGGIYQGGNWAYLGTSSSGFEWRLNGKRLNKRAYTGQQFGGGSQSIAAIPKNAVKVSIPGKHRYLMPLDDEMRKQIEPLRKPYPKRVRSIGSDATAIQAVEGGATPTRTLIK